MSRQRSRTVGSVWRHLLQWRYPGPHRDRRRSRIRHRCVIRIMACPNSGGEVARAAKGSRRAGCGDVADPAASTRSQ